MSNDSNTGWKRDAKCIPLWAGAKTRSRGIPVFMIADNVAKHLGDRGCYPDLTHGPTWREAVHMLALFLGCDDDVAREGVRFYRESESAIILTGEPATVWVIEAGQCDCNGHGAWSYRDEDWDLIELAHGITDPVSALAMAWREAVAAMKRPPEDSPEDCHMVTR